MITSLKNDKIKLVRALPQQRRERNRHKLFFIEGVAAIRAAYLYDWDVRWLIYCPEAGRTDWGLEVIAQTPPEARLEVNEYVRSELLLRDVVRCLRHHSYVRLGDLVQCFGSGVGLSLRSEASTGAESAVGVIFIGENQSLAAMSYRAGSAGSKNSRLFSRASK